MILARWTGFTRAFGAKGPAAYALLWLGASVVLIIASDPRTSSYWPT